jgi:zinc protease
MNIETLKYSNFQFTTVIKPEALTSSVVVTSDRFAENSPKNTALGLLYSDLLLSGAGKYSREEFVHELDLLGSSIQVGEDGGRVTITLTSLADKLSKTLALSSVMLKEPAFKPSELKRAKQTIANALELYKDNARALASDGLSRALFNEGDRRYKHPLEKVVQALKIITIKDLKSFHQCFMQANWTVTAGGSEKTTSAVNKIVAKVKKDVVIKERLLTVADVNLLTERKVVTHSVPSKQNIELSIGGHIPLSRTCPELPAFIFGIAVLGKWGGFAGRLMSTVREKEGLTYGIYARIEGISEKENGYWRIMTFFSPKDAKTGIQSTLREVTQISEKGITESEWKRFQVILRTGDHLVFDSLSSTVNLVHGTVVSGIGWGEYKKFREQLYSVTVAEVNSALKKYLKPNNLVISASGPVSAVTKDLKSFKEVR